MFLIELTSGRRFIADAGEAILNAASRGGISLPYSCKAGRCSTCKCKVIKGATRVLQPESGLTEEEKAEDWILSCVRAVETDVQLEVDDLGGIELPVAKTCPSRISEIKLLAPDVVRVLLRLPPAVDFRFIPGQYVQVIGPNGIRRSYSLANASFAERLLELHIRAVTGGAMSDYWFNHAKPHDLLRLHGPLGTFFLRETAGIDLFFLATGTGIAPVKAMLEAIERYSPEIRPKTVTVLWGGRQTKDLYFNAADIPGAYTWIPVLSRPAGDWAGSIGHVQNVLMDTNPDLTNAAVYACGSDAMIQDAKTCLIEAGLPSNRFYSDAFVSSGTN